MTADTKRCTKCGETKLRTEFNARRNRQVQPSCKVCARAYTAAWYKANLERERARRAAWKRANLEKNRAISRAYNAADPKKHRARTLAWQRANPEKHRAGRASIRARQRAALDPTRNSAAITDLFDTALLASQFTGDSFAVDHIVPLARGGRHHEDNLRILPSHLNLKKSARLDTEVTDPAFHSWLAGNSFEQVTFRSFHFRNHST